MDERRANILRILALVLFLAITALVIYFRDQVGHLANYGYPGIFLIAMLSSATVLLPAPGLAVVFAMGSVFHPLGVGVAAALGSTIGEISGYLAGFGGQAVIERMDIYNRILPYVTRYGTVAIVILAALPNPFFDLVGIAAGALKMPFWRFLAAVCAGLLIKNILIAYAGAMSIDWIAGIIASE